MPVVIVTFNYATAQLTHSRNSSAGLLFN